MNLQKVQIIFQSHLACNFTIVNMKSIKLPSPYLTPCGHWLPRNIQRAHYAKNNITFQHVCYYAHFWTDIKNAFATQFSTQLTQKLLKEMKYWHEFLEPMPISSQLPSMAKAGRADWFSELMLIFHIYVSSRNDGTIWDCWDISQLFFAVLEPFFCSIFGYFTQ